MEEKEKKETKQANFRITQKAADAFRAFCEENGWNQAEGFDRMIAQAELNKSKSALPSREVEIESFEKSMKDIMDAYLRSLEIYEDAEERIKMHYSSELTRKDRKIADLETEVSASEEKEKAEKKRKEEAISHSLQAMQEREEALEKAATLSRLADEKDKTIGNLTKQVASLEEKSAMCDALKASERLAQQSVSKLKSQVDTLTENIARAEQASKKEIERLTRQHETEVAALKKNHQAEVASLKAEADRKLGDTVKDHEVAMRELTAKMERQLSDTEKDAALSQSNAVAEKEREMTEKMNAALREADKEIVTLQVKLEALQEQIEKMRGAQRSRTE